MLRKLFFVFMTISLLISACGQATPQATQPTAPTLTPPPATETPIPPSPTAAIEAGDLPNTPEAMTFTDGLGRTVTLAAPAQAVVSMAPSNTELLFAVGAGAQVVGRDDFSDYPQEATALPGVGGSWSGYNNEAIVALKPDLVIAAEINTAEQVQALEDLGLTVYYLPNPLDFDGLYANLITVGKLTGHEAEAQALVESLKTRVAAAQARVANVTEKPSVYYELDATNPSAPYTAGPGTFIDMLISMAGGVNVGGKLSSPWAEISVEMLVTENPQIILLGDAAYGVTPESVAARAGWNGIEAVKNNRILPFDDNLASRPTSRLVDGLEALITLIHPELSQ